MYMYIHCTFRAAFKIELKGWGGGGGQKEFWCANNAISQDLKGGRMISKGG